MRSVHEHPGRPPVTTREALEHVAFELFADHGFDATTVEAIAAAAGVSRRTFFRYFASKNDIVWGDFDGLVARMEAWLQACPDDQPLFAALTEAVVRFNSLPPSALAAHRRRMTLILHVPALQAHSTLRYAEWRGVVARFVARRSGAAVDSLVPQLVGHVVLGAAVAAYERWLSDDSADLGSLLAAALGAVHVEVPAACGS